MANASQSHGLSDSRPSNVMNLPPFRDHRLLQQALTHRSYVNDYPEMVDNNERLEFLGDSVLNFLIGSWLYEQYPQMGEGDLTRWRSRLVDQTQLAQFGRALDLGSKLRLGKGVEKQGGRENPRLLCSAFEAIVGAYLLDTDLDTVRAYVRQLFSPVMATIGSQQTAIDPKSQLQVWALAQPPQTLPVYRLLHESGPDHAKTFTAEVLINGISYGQGQGHSKKEAEKQAALNALQRLDERGQLKNSGSR